MLKLKILTIFSYLILSLNLLTGQTMEKSDILVKFGNEITPFKVQGIFLMPGEHIDIEILYESATSDFSLTGSAGKIEKNDDNQWNYIAPSQKGIYPIILKKNGITSTVLNCIVLVPASNLKNERINGYRIGSYPNSNSQLYKNPKGFIEVTAENQLTKVSPHYVLKDFLCKQQANYPKYLVLRERGIIKLEKVQSELNKDSLIFKKFSFISGYRTPFYNKSIGNVTNSRHIFGDAYDIFIDEDSNGRMDDLNGDGKLSKSDALYLYNKINVMHKSEWFKPFIGGLGLYGPNSRHGGFIHIDSRGYKARWGN